MISKTKAEGVLLGLACGELIGRQAADQDRTSSQETQPWTSPDDSSSSSVGSKRGGDDLAFTLAVAQSILDCGGFHPDDVAERLIEQYQESPETASETTGLAIGQLIQGASWKDAGTRVVNARPESGARSASLKRSPPLALAYPTDIEKLAIASMRQSQITHADPRCTFGCAILNLTIAGYLTGQETPLEDALSWFRLDLPLVYSDALKPLIQDETVPDLKTTGYVVHALQTALHDAMKTSTLEEALVMTRNRGGQTETLCTLTGAVGGARFGAESLPDRWLSRLESRSKLKRLSRNLAQVGGKSS